MVAFLGDGENDNERQYKEDPHRYTQPVMEGKVCPYCLNGTEILDSAIFYEGKSYGMVCACKPCRAYVGIHNNTKKAKGSLANTRLRKLRKRAHNRFDPLWQRKMERDRCSQTEARNAGYNWLAKELNIPRELMHIGLLGEYDCQRVIDLCDRYSPKKQ